MLESEDESPVTSLAARSAVAERVRSNARARLQIDGAAFRDEHGRHVILRGVNFGGDAKVPFAPDGHTYRPTDFAGHRSVSFVGRPAPLDEIDSHFARLAHWGFNCLRLLTTWEAVEHAGPGDYDESYLEYFAEVCRRAGEHGFYVFVDFHQDAWSRMSGGDGAPGWTFEAAGLDFTQFDATNAALIMQHNYDAELGGRQSSYPTMSWAGNYSRPANGIMWTLFFAGNDFAPSAHVGDRTIQDFLQDHYFGAMRAVAERVADLDNVIGFDTLNEPGTGYIGKPLGNSILRGQGPLWSPLDGLAVASGMTRTLPDFVYGQGVVGVREVNRANATIWLPGRTDPFREAGAWDDDDDGEPVALIPDYFQRRGDRRVDHERDYIVPFFNRVAATIRAIRPDWLVFAEVDPFDAAQGRGFPGGMPERTVNATHWYDISALVTKRFSPEHMVHVFTGEVREGAQSIEDAYVRELGVLKDTGSKLNGAAPTLIGECGIQYDLNDAEGYARWAAGERAPGIWSAQTAALDLMYNALDRLLLSSTQWNYTVSNRNDPMIGDGWNQEDLSIWSIDQVVPDDPYSGGRAVEGFCRPYIRSAQGTIISQRFDRRSGLFEAEIEADADIDEPTEIFVPRGQYPSGVRWSVTPETAVSDDGQFLRARSLVAGRARFRVEPR
jgi:hypothetical protein